MKAFVTGGTGFIGGRVVAKLRERGDRVVALVRSPAKAQALRDLGCELVEGDLAAGHVMQAAMSGCDGVFHVAAVYKLGIPKSAQAEMLHANVVGTTNVLDAAIAAGVPRILYVSTCSVFGNTHGLVVQEAYQRDLSEGFLSTYDEAKYRAHEVAEQRIDASAPIVVVQPAAVYGPGDHSEVGNMIEQTARGRMPMIPFGAMGLGFVHIDDVADGILLAFDKGELGEAYALSGELATIRDLIQETAYIAGRHIPRLPMPTLAMRLSAPLGFLIGPLLGFPPNLRELIAASNGVTYWASDAKARRKLGFSPRPLEVGLRDTLAANPMLAAR
ncbi:MAG: NAD-dependent epimerase/dehydratase family protein [Solirubrobacteraceae bacterium]